MTPASAIALIDSDANHAYHFSYIAGVADVAARDAKDVLSNAERRGLIRHLGRGFYCSNRFGSETLAS